MRRSKPLKREAFLFLNPRSFPKPTKVWGASGLYPDFRII